MELAKEKHKQNSSKKIVNAWLLKLSIIFFIVAITVVCFFFFGGLKIFQPSIFVDNFKGSEFQIHTIDVENGDAFLIRLPENKTMLIDCGEEEYSDRVISYINQYFASEGLNKIDYFVITHPDSDHCGSGKKIIDTFKVDNLYRPTINGQNESFSTAEQEEYKTSESIAYENLIQSAKQQGTNMIFSREGEKISLKNSEIQFLSPAKTSYEEDNNYSAVIMIKYYTKSFLFMGDADESIETTLVEKYGKDLKADILKVGHHGSKTSTSQKFLEMVKPSYAIISASERSTLHPNKEVIERLNAINSQVLSTAEIGNFAVTVNHNSIIYSGQKTYINFWAIVFSIVFVALLIIIKLPFQSDKNSKKSQTQQI